MSINQRALTLTVRTRRVATLFGDLLGWGSAKSSGCFFLPCLACCLAACFLLPFFHIFFVLLHVLPLPFEICFLLSFASFSCHLPLIVFSACFLLAYLACYHFSSCSLLSSFVSFFVFLLAFFFHILLSCLLLQLAFFFRLPFLLPLAYSCPFLVSMQILSFFRFTKLLLWCAPRRSPWFLGVCGLCGLELTVCKSCAFSGGIATLLKIHGGDLTLVRCVLCVLCTLHVDPAP